MGWRLLGTGLSFTLFGVAGLVTGLVVFPLLFLMLRDPKHRQKVARSTLGWLFGMFIRIMSLLGVLSFTIQGLDRVPEDLNHLIVANHPTLIDVVFMVWLFPQADCVVKEAVIRNPFMRSVVLAANYISNKDPLQLIETCVDRLRSGSSLILFPEGTRSVPNQPRRFKLGASAVAVRADVRILPLTITCSPATLAKGEPWHKIPHRKPFFSIEIMSPRRVSDWVPEPTGLRERSRTLNRRLASFYEEVSPVVIAES